MKTKILLLACALAAIPATTTALRADLLDNLTVQIRLGQRPPPPPPAVVVVVEDRHPAGPAPWERSRWGRHSQPYYYYPGTDVYYRPSDRMWFYAERGRWRYGRNLPDSLRVDFNRSVTLSITGSRPYDYHQQVVARYPANYFGTRVRLRDDDRHDNRRDDHRDDNRGNDRDRRDDKGRDKK
jgi:hypothetical protein